MELNPIFEMGVVPRPNLWYVLSGIGDCPSMRVGHTCTHVVDGETGGKLYVIGGADPSGAFGDVYRLDLDTHAWDVADSVGFKARYEHSAFVAASQPSRIYVFGGADQTGNLNDVQAFDTVDRSWCSVVCAGSPPSPRTFHNGPCVGDRLIVYSGGSSGVDPVGDRQVYEFNVSTSSWSTIRVTGDPPKPRLGHLMVAVGDRIFVHGGMSGTTFYADLHVLDLSKSAWTSVKQKKDQPPARSGHGGFVSGTDVYVFGGMNRDGAMNDMYRLDTVSMKWTKVSIDGAPASNRLDFATSVIRIKVPLVDSSSDLEAPAQVGQQMLKLEDENEGHDDDDDDAQNGDSLSTFSPASDISSAPPKNKEDETSERTTVIQRITTTDAAGNQSSENQDAENQLSTGREEEDSQDRSLNNAMGACKLDASATKVCTTEEYKTLELALVHGGMDTDGEIFDDCLVMLLP